MPLYSKNNRILYWIAACRRVVQIGGIMISMHVKKGLADHGHQKGKIAGLQFPAGKMISSTILKTYPDQSDPI
jgi:hypothetical protein